MRRRQARDDRRRRIAAGHRRALRAAAAQQHQIAASSRIRSVCAGQRDDARARIVLARRRFTSEDGYRSPTAASAAIARPVPATRWRRSASAATRPSACKSAVRDSNFEPVGGEVLHRELAASACRRAARGSGMHALRAAILDVRMDVALDHERARRSSSVDGSSTGAKPVGAVDRDAVPGGEVAERVGDQAPLVAARARAARADRGRSRGRRRRRSPRG